MLITQVRAMAHSQPKEVKRFVKFATVGALGAVTDFAVLNLLIQLAGFHLALANVFSFSAAVAQNFMLNRRWTFPESRTRNAGGQLLQFLVVSLVGLGINTFLVVTIHHLLEDYWIHLVGQEALGYTVSYNFAKALAIGIVLFWNFLANRLWTYRGL
ncbi:MAG: GtrA family protein [Caldilineaceae bacterium]|nr:GtrA family protein [Caldilineaceae bacterium]MCB0099324.1 GtrA family protein [Caldilineaceae bacterium]